MSQRDAFDNVLSSLHDAMLNDAWWPAASALIDEVRGTMGNALLVGEGPKDDVRILFAAAHHRGQRQEDLEQDYLRNYHHCDERVPRVRALPDSKLVHVTDLYTEQELKTSRTHNEFSRRCNASNGLNVRLDGPDGSHITWATYDPTSSDGWQTSHIETIERLFPHIRHFVRVRQALADAEASGAPMAMLLENARLGVIQLQRRGRIIRLNPRALDILRRGDGMFDRGGCLRARMPVDNSRLERLLGQALPRHGETAAGGSVTVGRPDGLPRYEVHITPVSPRMTDFGLRSVAALVLVIDPARRPAIDRDTMAAALDLTPFQSQVAVMLAEGRSVGGIAAATGEQTGRVWESVQQMCSRHGLTGRADLIRLVFSFSSLGRSNR